MFKKDIRYSENLFVSAMYNIFNFYLKQRQIDKKS